MHHCQYLNTTVWVIFSAQVTLQQHHLVHWHEHYQVNYAVATKYYGQNMLLSECIYRHRHVYEFIAVIDRDGAQHAPVMLLHLRSCAAPLAAKHVHCCAHALC